MRHVACSLLYVDAETVLHQAVVELVGNRVVNYYPIEDELPATEWLGGVIFFSRNESDEGDCILQAYHFVLPNHPLCKEDFVTTHLLTE